MRISIQMIQDRLSQFDTHSFVSQPYISGRDMRYQSVRLARAPGCLFLQQTGNDVTLWGENDSCYIVIKNIDSQTAFFLVQDVFDYYNAWYEKLLIDIHASDFQTIINDACTLLKNPVYFVDANYKAIAMSQQYGRDSVNPEWTHLWDNGYLSVRNYSFVRKYNPHLENEKEASVHYFSAGMKPTQKYGFIYAGVRSEKEYFGHITVVEYEHKITESDCDVLEVLAKTLSASFRMDNEKSTSKRHNSTLRDLLEGRKVTTEELESMLQYRGWNVQGEYILCQIRLEEKISSGYMDTIAECCTRSSESAFSMEYENSILVLINAVPEKAFPEIEKIRGAIRGKGPFMAVSLPFSSIEDIPQFYKQTNYALDHCEEWQNEDIVFFHWMAVPYILLSNSMSEKYSAISHRILQLDKLDKEKGTEYIETLRCYLQFERSIALTSAKLFIHKNTLVYRIKKITELIHCDLDDPETRRYFLLSMEILNLNRETRP